MVSIGQRVKQQCESSSSCWTQSLRERRFHGSRQQAVAEICALVAVHTEQLPVPAGCAALNVLVLAIYCVRTRYTEQLALRSALTYTQIEPCFTNGFSCWPL